MIICQHKPKELLEEVQKTLSNVENIFLHTFFDEMGQSISKGHLLSEGVTIFGACREREQ